MTSPSANGAIGLMWFGKLDAGSGRKYNCENLVTVTFSQGEKRWSKTDPTTKSREGLRKRATVIALSRALFSISGTLTSRFRWGYFCWFSASTSIIVRQRRSFHRNLCLDVRSMVIRYRSSIRSIIGQRPIPQLRLCGTFWRVSCDISLWASSRTASI